MLRIKVEGKKVKPSQKGKPGERSPVKGAQSPSARPAAVLADFVSHARPAKERR